jgi:hypothetical protein
MFCAEATDCNGRIMARSLAQLHTESVFTLRKIKRLLNQTSSPWTRLHQDCNLVDDRPCGLVVWVPGYRSRGPGFDFQRYRSFWEVVGLERGPLKLVSTIEELRGRNSSGFGLKSRKNGRGDPLRLPRDTLYAQKLALTWPTKGCRSVGIVRSRTKATELII